MKITEAAKTRIKEILQDKETDTVFRTFLQGGGCAGFKYDFELGELNDDDITTEVGGGYLAVIDPYSNMYLEEAELDFKKELMGESFVINNPNVTTTCGCGSSIGF